MIKMIKGTSKPSNSIQSEGRIFFNFFFCRGLCGTIQLYNMALNKCKALFTCVEMKKYNM